MKKYIYILIMSCTFGALVSCVETTAPEDEYGKGYNLAGFVNGSQAVSAVADGSEYAVEVPMQVKGPAMNKTKGTVIVNIEVDESSTAIEGTHFSLSTKSIELTEGQDFLSLLPLAVMTQGVVPPATFSLVLKVSNVDGENVIANGSTINLNLVYQCPADLSGTYLVTNDSCNPSFTATISKNADGSWALSSADGGWLHQCTSNSTLLNPGNIVELCGEILPTSDLDYGGLGIGTILGGSFNEVTGVLTMEHEETYFDGGPRNWTSTYTRQ